MKYMKSRKRNMSGKVEDFVDMMKPKRKAKTW
jgi:hypothetical protein